MAPPYVKFLTENKKTQKYLRGIVLVIGAILIASASNYMMLFPLWGYKPLTFFLGAWMVLNVILGYFLKSTNTLYFFLSCISGLLLHLSFPDLSYTPVIFVAFVPLLGIIEKEVLNPGKKSAAVIFRYSYNAFLLWNILTTFWVANTAFLPSIVSFTLNSLFMTIPIMGYYLVRKHIGRRFGYLAFVGMWLSFEFIHLRWEISWPWLTLGNAFASRTFWIQWYEYTGHLGGSLWVLLANLLFFRLLWKIRKQVEIKVQDIIYPVFTIMVPLFASIFIYFSSPPQGKPINISIVQPNFEPHYEKFTIPESDQLERFIRLTKVGLSDTTDYVVYPETAFNYTNIDELPHSSYVHAFEDVLESFPKARIISGLSTYKFHDTFDASLKGLRPIKSNPDQKLWIQVRNAAYEFTHEGVTDQEHIKGKLVPGAEIFPYSKFLFFFKPIIEMAGGSVYGHDRNASPTVLTAGPAKVAPAICYESIYGYWMRKFVQNGADVFFVITNDGWWDNTPGHRQHLAYSVLRSIEFRRSIARSANTGISCFIDQHGRVWKPTQYGEEAVISGTLLANDQLTFYAKYGDFIGRLGLLLASICIAVLARIFIIKIRQKQGNTPKA